MIGSFKNSGRSNTPEYRRLSMKDVSLSPSESKTDDVSLFRYMGCEESVEEDAVEEDAGVCE